MRQTIPIAPSREVVRFDGTLELATRRATSLVVRAEGDSPLPGFSSGSPSGATEYRILPIAVANPLFFVPR
jgi:hypothetical protein